MEPEIESNPLAFRFGENSNAGTKILADLLFALRSSSSSTLLFNFLHKTFNKVERKHE